MRSALACRTSLYTFILLRLRVLLHRFQPPVRSETALGSFHGRIGASLLFDQINRTRSATICWKRRRSGRTSWLISAKHWGETGGTLGDKDKETRVRMGKLTLMRLRRRGATSGVMSISCVGNKEPILAPQVGLEPTTLRLTAKFQGEAMRTQEHRSLKTAVL